MNWGFDSSTIMELEEPFSQQINLNKFLKKAGDFLTPVSLNISLAPPWFS